MSKWLNRARVLTTTTGTGTVTLGAAVLSFQTFAAAGAIDGGTLKILIEDGTAWEVSLGVYTASGPSITRILIESSTGSLLNLTGNAIVSVIQEANDLTMLRIEPTTSKFTNNSGNDGVTLVNSVQGGVETSGNMGGTRTSRFWYFAIADASITLQAICTYEQHDAFYVNGPGFGNNAVDYNVILGNGYCDSENTGVVTGLARYATASAQAVEHYTFRRAQVYQIGYHIEYDKTANTITAWATYNGTSWHQCGQVTSISTKFTSGVGRAGLWAFTTASTAVPFGFGCTHFELVPFGTPRPKKMF